MGAYFNNRNYVAIYLHNFFDAFGKSMLEVFSVVILYQLGVPVPFIALFLAFKFGCMGILSPLSVVLTSRIGLNTTITLSSVSYIVGVYLLVMGSYENALLLFSSVFFFALKGALYHPLINGVISMYINDEHRGRFNSFNSIFKTFAALLSIGISTILLIHELHIYVVLVIATALILSVISYVFLLEDRELRSTYSIYDVYHFLFSQGFRENLAPFSLQALLIIERILIPLFIFIYFENFETTAYIVMTAVGLEAIVLYLFGKYIDRFSKQSFYNASLIRSLNPIIFLLSHFSGVFVYVGQIYVRIAENVFNASFETKLQTKARKIDDPILFVVGKEMTLCFTESGVLLILALLAYAVQEHVFSFVFAGSFLAIWVLYMSWRD